MAAALSSSRRALHTLTRRLLLHPSPAAAPALRAPIPRHFPSRSTSSPSFRSFTTTRPEAGRRHMLVLPRLPQQQAQRLARAPGASLAPLPPDASPPCSLLKPHPSRIPAPTAPSRSHPSASPPPRHANFGGAQNPVALLQLCVGRRCLIFQLLHVDRVPMALAAFLADPDLCFVGVGVEADAERLRDDHGLEVASTVDLRGLAAEGMGRPDLRRAGLQAVVRVVMGVNLVKPQRVTMSRWDAYCLSEEQIKYACIDAFVSFEVGQRLLTGADY